MQAMNATVILSVSFIEDYATATAELTVLYLNFLRGHYKLFFLTKCFSVHVLVYVVKTKSLIVKDSHMLHIYTILVLLNQMPVGGYQPKRQ